MRHVVFLAVPPVQILDLAGPFEVFARCGGYRVTLATTARRSEVDTSCGLRLANAVDYRRLRGAIDTLVVPGGDGAEAQEPDAAVLRWLADAARRTRRVASICTGSFLLAGAGLLDGRRATTHWAFCQLLAQRFPRVDVDPKPLFVQDGGIHTSAGVTSGIDLALALVEEDHGRQRAKQIARDLVLYLRRSGGQSQFSAFLPQPVPERHSLEELLRWIPDHLAGNLRVDALAARVAMSPRHFARVFVRETGITPLQYVERTRATVARELLEDSQLPVKTIAARCGYADADTLRRAFQRVWRVSPARYRQSLAEGVPTGVSASAANPSSSRRSG